MLRATVKCGKESDFLDDVSDHAAQADYVPLVEGAAVHVDRACALRKQAIDELQGGGLARAAAAQQHQGFAALHFQVEIAKQSGSVIQAVADVAELDGRAGVGRIVHALFSHRRIRCCEGKMPSRQPASLP